MRVRNGLEGLRHAAGLMIHTVNQLMNTSAQSNPRLIHDNVNFALLVERACQYYQGIAARKRIGIVFSSTEVPNAWTDRVAVAAVLDNLLSNAVKYSLPGTRIRVTVRHESAGLACRVQDEGPGISREDQAKLFQRGVRLSALPTGGEPSTGYGLSVAKELVDNLGGKIWCESELGKGLVSVSRCRPLLVRRGTLIRTDRFRLWGPQHKYSFPQRTVVSRPAATPFLWFAGSQNLEVLPVPLGERNLYCPKMKRLHRASSSRSLSPWGFPVLGLRYRKLAKKGMNVAAAITPADRADSKSRIFGNPGHECTAW